VKVPVDIDIRANERVVEWVDDHVSDRTTQLAQVSRTQNQDAPSALPIPLAKPKNREPTITLGHVK
jgi:hypothetical protein